VKRLSLWGPVVLMMALIFVASSIPDVPALPGGVSDKTAHSWAYGLLGVLVFRALAKGRVGGLTIVRGLGSILIATAYGISDEFHQSFVPGRTSDVRDVAADAIGAIAAAIALLLVRYLIGVAGRSKAASPPPAD
jgi:VanZ family protein